MAASRTAAVADGWISILRRPDYNQTKTVPGAGFSSQPGSAGLGLYQIGNLRSRFPVFQQAVQGCRPAHLLLAALSWQPLSFTRRRRPNPNQEGSATGHTHTAKPQSQYPAP